MLFFSGGDVSESNQGLGLAAPVRTPSAQTPRVNHDQTTPEVEDLRLPLTLLMLGIFAYHSYNTTPPNNLALRTAPLHRG